MKKIVILGFGGNCIDILDTLHDINDTQGEKLYKCLGFLDDDKNKWNQSVYGVGVLGPLGIANDMKDCYFVFGIGSVANFWNRHEILLKTGIKEDRFETVIHPTASISRMAKVGIGTVIFQNVTISSNVVIGNHVYILPNSVISHDDIIGDFTSIAGGVCISGNVRVGHSCYIGTNSTIKERVIIGDYCLVGMASVVLDHVPDNHVVVGTPARFLRKCMP